MAIIFRPFPPALTVTFRFYISFLHDVIKRMYFYENKNSSLGGSFVAMVKDKTRLKAWLLGDPRPVESVLERERDKASTTS